MKNQVTSENQMAVSVLFDPITTIPCIKSDLRYLETYLTFLNTNDTPYSTEAWDLMDMLMEDALKIETLFWRALALLATIFGGPGDKETQLSPSGP